MIGPRCMLHLQSVMLHEQEYLFSRGKNRFLRYDEDDGVYLLQSLNVEGVVADDDADGALRFESLLN